MANTWTVLLVWFSVPMYTSQGGAMTELEQKLWEAVYNLTTPEMPEGDGVLEAIQKPMSDDLPHWLEKVIEDDGSLMGHLYLGDLRGVWNHLSLESRLVCVLMSMRERLRYGPDPHDYT